MVPSTSTIDRFLSYILRLAVLFTCHDDYADDHRLTDSHAAVDFGISPLPSQSCMGELRIEETRPDHSLPLGLVKKKKVVLVAMQKLPTKAKRSTVQTREYVAFYCGEVVYCRPLPVCPL
jgi:hypothetical protein